MLLVQSSGSVRIYSVDYDALLSSLKERAAQAREVHPELRRMLLFGSFAKGNYTPESDVDILVVVADTAVPFLERRDAFIGFFSGIPFDVNILVYTERELKKMLDEGNPFAIGASKGIEL